MSKLHGALLATPGYAIKNNLVSIGEKPRVLRAANAFHGFALSEGRLFCHQLKRVGGPKSCRIFGRDSNEAEPQDSKKATKR
jgi:hypothetical protein